MTSEHRGKSTGGVYKGENYFTSPCSWKVSLPGFREGNAWTGCSASLASSVVLPHGILSHSSCFSVQLTVMLSSCLLSSCLLSDCPLSGCPLSGCLLSDCLYLVRSGLRWRHCDQRLERLSMVRKVPGSKHSLCSGFFKNTLCVHPAVNRYLGLLRAGAGERRWWEGVAPHLSYIVARNKLALSQPLPLQPSTAMGTTFTLTFMV